MGAACKQDADCCNPGALVCDPTNKVCTSSACEAMKGSSCFTGGPAGVCATSDCNAAGVAFCNAAKPDLTINQQCLFCGGYAEGLYACDPGVGRICTWKYAGAGKNPSGKELCLEVGATLPGYGLVTQNDSGCFVPNKNICDATGVGTLNCGICPVLACVNYNGPCTDGPGVAATPCTAGYWCKPHVVAGDACAPVVGTCTTITPAGNDPCVKPTDCQSGVCTNKVCQSLADQPCPAQACFQVTSSGPYPTTNCNGVPNKVNLFCPSHPVPFPASSP